MAFHAFSLCGTAAFPAAIRIFLPNYAEGFFPCFFRSLLPGSASGAACHPQWAPRGLLFSSGDSAQIRLLSRLCHGRFCPCQMLPLQRHGSVVWPRYYMQRCVLAVLSAWAKIFLKENFTCELFLVFELAGIYIYIYISFLAAIRCSDPDPIENGDVERKCQTFGCRISYKCRAGYELDGRQHRYCQADGSWSPRILPQCVRKWILVICGLKLPTYIYFFKLFFAAIQCEQPQNPLNGRAIYDSVSYNSLISYECNYGYMLIGDSVRRCERNKMWTGTEPTCKGKCCKWCTQHTKGLLSIHHHHEEALLLLLLVYTECKQRMGRLGVD